MGRLVADGHIAPRGAGSTPSAWSARPLGADVIHKAVAAAGLGPGFLGVKITVNPAAASVPERLAVAARALELVALATGEGRGLAAP